MTQTIENIPEQDDISARVSRGIALLDRNLVDRGWRQKINPKTLDIGSCSTCILGQLFGSFHSRGSREARNGASAVDFGFSAHPFHLSGKSLSREEMRLADEWRKQLAKGGSK